MNVFMTELRTSLLTENPSQHMSNLGFSPTTEVLQTRDGVLQTISQKILKSYLCGTPYKYIFHKYS